MRVFCVVLSISCFLLQGCFRPNEYESPDYSRDYEPIYFSRSDLDLSIKIEPSRPIAKSGKIYVFGNFLFIGDDNLGFHIFENSDPTNPINLGFLSVAGSTDLAVRQNSIFINQSTDLLALEFDQTQGKINLIKRIENTFPPLKSPDGFEADSIPSNVIVLDWKPKN